MKSSGGGFNRVVELVKATKNKPKASAIALFNRMRYGRVRRKSLEIAMGNANGWTVNTMCKSGYNASTLAWHVNSGRIRRFKENGITFFELTDVGIRYCLERKLL